MKRIVLLLAIITLPLWAVWQNPTPVCTAAGDQENFLALPYADGGVLVLWEDYRNGDADIYAQALDAKGNALWQENGVSVITESGHQTDLDAVVLESGDVVVAWDDKRVSDQHSVYVQKLGPDGSLKWNADGVPVRVSESAQTFPTLCSSNDGVIVLWSKGGSFAHSIRTRRVSANGEVAWPDTGIYICGIDVGLGDVVPDLHGGTIIPYIQIYQSPGEASTEFRVQRLDSLGNLLWGDSGILLYTWVREGLLMSNGEYTPWSVTNGSGGAIVIYHAQQWFAQQVDSNGNILWSDSGVAVAPVSPDIHGGHSSISDGGMYIVRGSPDAYPDEYLHAHRLTLEGETPFGDSGIEVWRVWAADPVYDVEPRVTEEGTITWRDSWDRGIGDDRYEERGILAQRIDTSGNVLWPQEVLICSTSGYSPRIVSTTDKGAIVVWKDIRNGNTDIYSAHIDSSGNVSAIEEFYPKMEPKIQLEVGLNHLIYSVPSQTHFSVYSCTGRLLREETVSGKGKFIPTGLPAGIYFLQFRDKTQNVTAKLVVVK